MRQMLKYFAKYLLVTFLIEILWFMVCVTAGYYINYNLSRHLLGIGFIIIPFIISYHTMYKKIDELEAYAESQYKKRGNKK